jgi:hypothetical protein
MFFPRKYVLSAALDLRNLRARKDPNAFMLDSDRAIQTVVDVLPVERMFTEVISRMRTEAAEGRPPEAVLMALVLEGLTLGYVAAEVEREIEKTTSHRA